MNPLLLIVLAAAPLGFDDALALAARAPAVVASTRAAQLSRERGRQVSSLETNPTVGLQPGVRTNALGTGPELIGVLSQSFNVAGSAGARREALARETAQDLGHAQLAAHRTRLSVAQAWLAAWSARGVLEEAQRELEAARELGARFERAAKSGAVTRADLAAIRAWVAEAHLAVLAAEGARFEAGVRLNQALGLDASAPAEVTSALPAFPADEAALVRSLDAADQAPEARLAAQTRAAEEARLAEHRASNGTWLQLGATGGREGLGDVVVLGTVSVTLPTFNHGEREAAPLEAAIARAEGERAAAIASARAARVLATHELEHTREVLEVVERELVPAHEEAAAGTQRRMEEGESTSQEWLLARRALLAAKSRLVAARADHALARFRARELSAVTAGEAP